MARIRDFINRPLNTTSVSGWRWHAAVLRKWRWWYLFWLAFIGLDVWWMVGR